MLKAFINFREKKLEEDEALFLAPGWGAPSQHTLAPSTDFVRWSEVEVFIRMAEQALSVKCQTNDHLRQQLVEEKESRSRVQATSSAAVEESAFLAEHMQGLMNERAALREALETAQRERDALLQQNDLLLQGLQEGEALSEESGAVLALLARKEEELRAAAAEGRALAQRNAQLENDNVQLQARVSALERANTAQATAMISCLEESERVRLQQQLSTSIPTSPRQAAGPRCRHALTSDGGNSASGDPCRQSSGAYTDALELGSDGSYASCATPFNSASSRGNADSVFSASPSPSPSRASSVQQQAPSSSKDRKPAEGGSRSIMDNK